MLNDLWREVDRKYRPQLNSESIQQLEPFIKKQREGIKSMNDILMDNEKIKHHLMLKSIDNVKKSLSED